VVVVVAAAGEISSHHETRAPFPDYSACKKPSIFMYELSEVPENGKSYQTLVNNKCYSVAISVGSRRFSMPQLLFIWFHLY
jgi:hypothetical protein